MRAEAGATAEPAVSICEGDVLADRYVVEHVLGTGGMGVVVSAKDRQLGRRVAIKLLSDVLLADAETLRRFQREARVLAALESEHVARVLDVVVGDTGPMLVMEHLAGTDLEKVLASRGSLPVAEAVDYLLQACEAIAEAHVAGIVHRDLKPANLFLSRRADGTTSLKVLDFGIAKLASGDGQEDHVLTRTGVVLGSPRYMSPEQVRNSKSVEPRTDIWALGAVLYQLLTGAPPFDAETVPALSAAIVSDPAPLLRSTLPDAPAELEQLVLRCLEKDPAYRFATVAELADALAPFASAEGRTSVARVGAIMAHTTPAAPSVPEPSGEQSSLDRTGTRPTAVWRGPQWIGAALVTCAAVAIVAFLVRPRAMEPDGDATPPQSASSAPSGEAHAVEVAPSEVAPTETPTVEPAPPSSASAPVLAPRRARGGSRPAMRPASRAASPVQPPNDDGLDERH